MEAININIEDAPRSSALVSILRWGKVMEFDCGSLYLRSINYAEGECMCDGEIERGECDCGNKKRWLEMLAELDNCSVEPLIELLTCGSGNIMGVKMKRVEGFPDYITIEFTTPVVMVANDGRKDYPVTVSKITGEIGWEYDNDEGFESIDIYLRDITVNR